MAQLRLICAAAVALATAFAAPARAGITPPAGWTSAPDAANAANAAVVPHLGAEHPIVTVDAYSPPAPAPGSAITLIVTHIAAPVPPATGSAASGDDAAAAAIRAEIDAFHGASHRAQLAGGTIDEQTWQSHADAQLVTADLAYTDKVTSIATTSRIAIARSKTQLVAITGECIAQTASAASLQRACQTALASLDPDLPRDQRVALALAPEGTPPPELPSHEAPVDHMTPADHIPLAPIEVPPPPAPAADKRPVFIGGGVVLLAALFWWNMRRRARLEAHEEDSDDR